MISRRWTLLHLDSPARAIFSRRTPRAIDRLELEDSGTIIDRINRAERRGLINSAWEFKEIRELRNLIAHEYAEEDLTRLYANVIKRTPPLIEILDPVKEYCQKLK